MTAGADWDVVVVGAGVGGMALATRLAGRGFAVVMIEPRPPVVFRVGESLDWEAPVFLRQLGISIDQLVAEGKATYKGGAVATSAAQPDVEAVIGFSPLFRLLMGLVGRHRPTIHANRELVDQDLMNTACAAGARLVVGRARSVEVDGARVAGVTLEDGRQLHARFYVDATGSAARFRKAFGIGQRNIGPRKVVVRARFPHPYDGMGTRIRTDDSLSQPAWIWDINVSDAITDIGIVVAEQDFAPMRRRFPSLRDLFLHQTSKHPGLHAWLEPLVTAETEFWTCSFQDLVAHRSHGENWIAVGEAAFVVDAILSSGFTMSLRTGFLASDIIAEALARGRQNLCPKRGHIYHEKTAAQVGTIDGLIDVLWYRGRLREHYALMLNVLSILVFNFNLNHLHTRYTPRTLLELELLKRFHRAIDTFVPAYDAFLTQRAVRRGLVNPHLVQVPV
jgi:flavin-dependent dehydrogenase